MISKQTRACASCGPEERGADSGLSLINKSLFLMFKQGINNLELFLNSFLKFGKSMVCRLLIHVEATCSCSVESLAMPLGRKVNLYY